MGEGKCFVIVVVVVVFLFRKIFFQWIIIDRVFRVQKEPKKYINYGEENVLLSLLLFYFGKYFFNG